MSNIITELTAIRTRIDELEKQVKTEFPKTGGRYRYQHRTGRDIRNGQECVCLGEKPSIGWYEIKFDDGDTGMCWPDELTPVDSPPELPPQWRHESDPPKKRTVRFGEHFIWGSWPVNDKAVQRCSLLDGTLGEHWPLVPAQPRPENPILDCAIEIDHYANPSNSAWRQEKLITKMKIIEKYAPAIAREEVVKRLEELKRIEATTDMAGAMIRLHSMIHELKAGG